MQNLDRGMESPGECICTKSLQTPVNLVEIHVPNEVAIIIGQPREPIGQPRYFVKHTENTKTNTIIITENQGSKLPKVREKIEIMR